MCEVTHPTVCSKLELSPGFHVGDRTYPALSFSFEGEDGTAYGPFSFYASESEMFRLSNGFAVTLASAIGLARGRDN